MAKVERHRLRHLLSHLFLCLVGFTTLVPFLWMVLTSLKSEGEVFQSHVWPQEVRLGNEGDLLLTRQGRPILDETGQPIPITLGNPLMIGAPGDPIRDQQGRLIYDPQGQPIPIKNAEERQGIAVYKNRWDPVQVDGKPLILTEALQRKWQQRLIQQRANWRLARELPPAQVELEDGAILRRPSGEPYTYRDISWDRVGEPVLDVLSRQPILGEDGAPIAFRPAFPVLKGDNDPLMKGTEVLYGIFPGKEESRIVYGSDVRQTSHTRFMFSNYIRVLRDPEIKFSLFGWNSLLVAVCVMAGQVLTSAMAGVIGFFTAVSVGAARPDLGVFVTGKGLVVMVLGGLGSLPGAIVGGIVLGVLEFQATWFLDATYRDMMAFLILFVILVFRPSGLLGARTS